VKSGEVDHIRLIHAAALVLILPALAHGQSPEEAAAVLRANQRPIYIAAAPRSGPLVVIISGSKSSGPFGEFRPFPRIAPVRRGPQIFRQPRFTRPRFRVGGSPIVVSTLLTKSRVKATTMTTMTTRRWRGR
jgi:hypothetical protein